MGLHHCIQLCTGSVPAATAEPSVDGMMSTQLYLALCEGRNDEAMAMMAADDQIAGKPPHHNSEPQWPPIYIFRDENVCTHWKYLLKYLNLS
jgi:hypothetical protein